MGRSCLFSKHFTFKEICDCMRFHAASITLWEANNATLGKGAGTLAFENALLFLHTIRSSVCVPLRHAAFFFLPWHWAAYHSRGWLPLAGFDQTLFLDTPPLRLYSACHERTWRPLPLHLSQKSSLQFPDGLWGGLMECHRLLRVGEKCQALRGSPGPGPDAPH